MKVIRLAAITRLSVLLLMGGCISSRPGALLNGIKTDDIEYRSDDELRAERLSLLEEMYRLTRIQPEHGMAWLPSRERSVCDRDQMVLDILRLRFLAALTEDRIAEINVSRAEKISTDKSRSPPSEMLNTIKTDDIKHRSDDELRDMRRALYEETDRLNEARRELGLSPSPSSKGTAYERDEMVLDVLVLRHIVRIEGRIVEIVGKQFEKKTDSRGEHDESNMDSLIREIHDSDR